MLVSSKGVIMLVSSKGVIDYSLIEVRFSNMRYLKRKSYRIFFSKRDYRISFIREEVNRI